MGLFSRKQAAGLALSPEGPFRATDTITATVTLDEALDKVTSARVELGYVNGYRYMWAGKGDATLRQGNDSWLTMGQVGTNYGSDKDTEDWVHVLDQELVVAGGVLGAGQHTASLRLPSWSPGSSKEVVRWEVRLHVERGGKDVSASAPLTVLVAAPDPLPELPLVQGQSALNNTVTFEIETERPSYKPGEEVRGVVAVTPREPVTRKALLALWFRKEQTSHPVEKNPGQTVEMFTRPMVSIVKDVQLVQGQRVEFPFTATLPADVDPSTEAVHSSLTWWVQIKLEFSGATGGIERAERGIVVHTA